MCLQHRHARQRALHDKEYLQQRLGDLAGSSRRRPVRIMSWSMFCLQHTDHLGTMMRDQHWLCMHKCTSYSCTGPKSQVMGQAALVLKKPVVVKVKVSTGSLCAAFKLSLQCIMMLSGQSAIISLAYTGQLQLAARESPQDPFAVW